MQLDPILLAQRKKMQLEIMLKESDVKKLTRSKLEAEVFIRDLKHKAAQIQMDIAVKENTIKKIQSDTILLQNEIIKLKHKMNDLGR